MAATPLSTTTTGSCSCSPYVPTPRQRTDQSARWEPKERGGAQRGHNMIHTEIQGVDSQVQLLVGYKSLFVRSSPRFILWLLKASMPSRLLSVVEIVMCSLSFCTMLIQLSLVDVTFFRQLVWFIQYLYRGGWCMRLNNFVIPPPPTF